ncbi:hypothetical protein N7540_012053 [Penicillium herquei]|nr:hypothetical protein N7540_012053 [Penicillium herquei]
MALHPHEFTSFERYTDLKQIHEQNVRISLQRQDFKPLFLYHPLLLFCLPLIGLLIPRRWGTRFMRPLAFALTLATASDVILNRRTHSCGNGYGIGILASWWIIWSGTLLIIRDVERDFRRIERMSVSMFVHATHASCIPTVNDLRSDGKEREGLGASSVDVSFVPADQRSPARKCDFRTPGRAYMAGREQRDLLYWQSYPENFLHRLNWCLGLLLALRGLEWNWRSPHTGPIPKSAHKVLRSGFDSSNFFIEDDARFQTKKQLWVSMFTFLSSYILIDIIRALVMEDRFFLGHIAAAEAMPSFLLSFTAASPFLHRWYRQVSFILVAYFGFKAIASGLLIISIGFSLAFPKTFQKATYSPLDMPWLYANPFGSFLSNIRHHGLAGFWGRFWHQFLRYGLANTAQWTLRFVPISCRANKQVVQGVNLPIVFLLSAFIHACGSYTQLAETSASRPFLFFCLQGAGLIVESIFKSFFNSISPLRNMPQWIRHTANSMFVVTWIFITAPLMMDDALKGGVIFGEFVPVSILGFLGIAYDGQWFHWSGPWFEYWSDGTYWGSGLRII